MYVRECIRVLKPHAFTSSRECEQHICTIVRLYTNIMTNLFLLSSCSEYPRISPSCSPRTSGYESRSFFHAYLLREDEEKEGNATYSERFAYDVNPFSLQSMPTMASPRPQLTSARIFGSL